jgi:hypothetical protein
MLTREEDFERAAERFRERVGIVHCVFVDGLTLLQKLKRYYGVGHLGVSSLPPNSEGEFDERKKIIRLPEAVLRASYWAEPRARMTIAHEAAHVALGHVGIVNRSTVKSQAESLSTLVARQEREAKRLAPAILAPLKLMHETMSVDDIALRFGLSKQAAEIRRTQFLEVDRRKRGVPRALPDFVVALKRELNGRGDSLSERTQFADRECRSCGQTSMIPVGTKFLCVNCDATSDRDPD